MILVPNDTFLFKLIWFLWRFYKGKIWENTHLHNFREGYLMDVCGEVGLEPETRKKFLLGMLYAAKLRKR